MMKWILIMWAGFADPTMEQTITFEECKARAEARLPRSDRGFPYRAFCVKKDGTSVVQIELKDDKNDSKKYR